MTHKVLYYISAVAALAMVLSCTKSGDDVYVNQIYFDRVSENTVTDIPVSINDAFSEDISLSMPRRENIDVKTKIAVDESLVQEFNTRYGESAVLLP